LEDIKRDYEETSNRHTKDRILRSRNDSPARVTSVGNRTHKDSLMKKTFKEFAEACWDSHKQVGFKMKGGKRVPNCVPKNEDNLDERKVRITKNGKELLVWDAELRTYQQMGWKLVDKELNELGPAAMKRLARKRAYAAKTMAKYGQAAKMGIPASKVNQRRNTPTRTK
jgi:hypothetical protein